MPRPYENAEFFFFRFTPQHWLLCHMELHLFEFEFFFRSHVEAIYSSSRVNKCTTTLSPGKLAPGISTSRFDFPNSNSK